jgi:soluble lytic murein transglycosylase
MKFNLRSIVLLMAAGVAAGPLSGGRLPGIAGAYAQATMAPIADGGETSAARRVKPHAQYLSVQDAAILGQAFDLADRAQWDAARSAAGGASNAIVRRLVDWRFASAANSGADFNTISQFIAANPDFPNMNGLRARAEAAMPASAMDAGQVVAWFGSREPRSGDGFVKLGDALIRSGQRARGEATIRQGWIEAEPSDAAMALVWSQYPNLIGAREHEARLSRLLWARKYGPAQAMFGRVSGGAAAAATARIKLQGSARDAEQAYNAVPSDYRDAGLLFDRARWLRRRDRDAEARSLLIQAGEQMAGTAPDADAWWDERNVLARKALDVGQIADAYALASGHKIRAEDNLVDFAEGEFLAGWIALQFQNRPDVALGHFHKLRQGVTAPISAARAHYWAGRALAKAGRQSEARGEYEQAGKFPMTYYGMLALNEVAGKVRLAVPAGFRPNNDRSFSERPVVAGMRALADIGDQGRVRSFILAAAEAMDNGQEYANLVAAVRAAGEPSLALRVAKRALQKNLPLFELAYPTMALPAYAGQGAGPESAMVLGIMRQESEFDPAVRSPANARGLMQLIPSTAKMTANRHGIAYSGADSLYNATTNMLLGMAHMGDLLGDFAGSYVMIAGAYNAGGGRVNEWVGRFGDPRASGTDVIDWVERVPFSETRNYIQRVLENTQIYRAILNGRDAPLTLAADLRRGGYTALASAQFTSDATQAQSAVVPPVAAPAATPRLEAAVRSSAPIPDEDEVKPALTPKPKATAKPPSKEMAKGKSKGKPKAQTAKRKSDAKSKSASRTKPARSPARTDAAPRCKPGSKSKECRRGRS